MIYFLKYFHASFRSDATEVRAALAPAPDAEVLRAPREQRGPRDPRPPLAPVVGPNRGPRVREPVLAAVDAARALLPDLPAPDTRLQPLSWKLQPALKAPAVPPVLPVRGPQLLPLHHADVRALRRRQEALRDALQRTGGGETVPPTGPGAEKD